MRACKMVIDLLHALIFILYRSIICASLLLLPLFGYPPLPESYDMECRSTTNPQRNNLMERIAKEPHSSLNNMQAIWKSINLPSDSTSLPLKSNSRCLSICRNLNRRAHRKAYRLSKPLISPLMTCCKQLAISN